METTTFDTDIKVFYVTASSFPAGIMVAHERLHDLVPLTGNRRYFGVSRPEGNGGEIIYRAAAEELQPGESAAFHCDTLVLQKGAYHSIAIHDYMKDIPAIGKAFDAILELPDIDPEGYCVEWYLNDTDVVCMVRKAA